MFLKSKAFLVNLLRRPIRHFRLGIGHGCVQENQAEAAVSLSAQATFGMNRIVITTPSSSSISQ